ncbi:MAG: hypothetical protein L6R38_008668 [Xanthoria sp. 2 TBL-2021]|nr:MAG: hypothetical protein L6R38_008668 [Xanthoria sp. 2 TBL-2021]
MALFSSLACLVQVLALALSARAAPKLLPSTLDPNVTRYAVHSLPDVSFHMTPSWAGQIPIPGVADDQLFFWLFQAENHNASQNLIIWLNGGPGCSSLTGLTYENGPFQFQGRTPVPSPNPYSWTKLANVVYIDQPPGTGYSSGSKAASNNAEVTKDFFHWLMAFYDRFPALKYKNTYIMGESYAGVYIPYFAEALLSNRNILNINLKAIVLGDPTLGNTAAMTDVVTTTYLHQIAPLYKIPLPILSAFAAADQQCGFDKIISQLTYPPTGKIQIPGNPEGLNFMLQHKQRKRKRQVPCFDAIPDTPSLINDSINAPCSIGCATYTTAFAYLPTLNTCFDPYNIRATCHSPRDDSGPTYWLNQAAVRKAIHAPEKRVESCNETVFDTLSQEEVEPAAYRVLPEILGRGVKVHVYSGNLDALLNHWGTELVVQNMTWYAMVLFLPGAVSVSVSSVVFMWLVDMDGCMNKFADDDGL